MKRRTLDLIFSVGGLLAALLILVLGLVLQNQASFAKNYVHDQLAQQKITFTPVSGLKSDENDPCLRTYAGQLMTTGAQAQCYANHYIGVHVGLINDGKTYSQTSGDARALQAQLAAMPDQNSPQAKQLAAQAATTEAKATTLFQGETLRGLLLTSYGFSIFGERAQEAAWVCFGLAFVLFVAAIAGFVHAATKSADHRIGTDDVDIREPDREPQPA
jgi:hypothetical protein